MDGHAANGRRTIGIEVRIVESIDSDTHRTTAGECQQHRRRAASVDRDLLRVKNECRRCRGNLLQRSCILPIEQSRLNPHSGHLDALRPVWRSMRRNLQNLS